MFNDLAYSATRLIAEGMARSVLIIGVMFIRVTGRRVSLPTSPTSSPVRCIRANYPARKATSDLDVEVERHIDDAGYVEYLPAGAA